MKGYAPSIQSALNASDEAKRVLERAIAQRQSRCRHLDLIECDYKPLGDGALQPMRCCRSCGMSEDGWGAGYIVLKGQAFGVSREAIYEHRLGLHIYDEHKGLLLRGETTVKQLVEKKFNEKASFV